MELFPAGQDAKPLLLEFVEQLEEIIAKDLVSLPKEEHDRYFDDLDLVTAMFRI
ncbi:hypothetical protein D3C77_772640 [compost metagenome]